MPEWDELFQEKEHRWDNIHDRIPGFAEQMRARGGRSILDLGCGAGRHTQYLAADGFTVSGFDASKTGLEFTRKRLEANGLQADLRQGDMECLPYPDKTFDGLISIHVIFHNTLAGMQRTLAEIRRVLKPGGLALVTFQSKRSWRYGRGIRIEEDTYLPDVGGDAGIPHHYSSLGEFECILEGFIVRDVHLQETLDDQNHTRSSHWEVLMEKPETAT